MNIRKAIDDTMILANERVLRMPEIKLLGHPSLGLQHIVDMHVQIKTSEMSDTKLCRWLGWMQAAIVAWGCASLEDMKQINMRNAE